MRGNAATTPKRGQPRHSRTACKGASPRLIPKGEGVNGR
jgi:hypothetical protein